MGRKTNDESKNWSSRRRKRERERRRREILEAGAKVFGRLGYSAATMELIAREAELGKASMYYYFKGKEDLYVAILEQGLKDLKKQFEDSGPLDAGNPADRLEAMLKGALDYFRKHRRELSLFLSLIASQGRGMGADTLRRISKQFMEAHQPFRKVLYDLDELASTGGSISDLVTTFMLGMGLKVAYRTGRKHGGGLEEQIGRFVSMLSRWMS
ncbi:MAG: TetR/AcrR family transcriptional regulator [Deltaproteobacteria bacterium]|nr:TetR/AcrR family transcriptional regulator [Deltaproteobacteria bacterium]